MEIYFHVSNSYPLLVNLCFQHMKSISETRKSISETWKYISESWKLIFVSWKPISKTWKSIPETWKSVSETWKSISETSKHESSLGRSLQSVEINFHECIDLPRQVGQYSFVSGSLYSVMST